MRRARKLGRRYIRTLTDVVRSAFGHAGFRARVAENVTHNNALLRAMLRNDSLTKSVGPTLRDAGRS